MEIRTTTIIEKDDFDSINMEEDQSLGNIIASASFVFITAGIIAINSMGFRYVVHCYSPLLLLFLK